MNPDKYFLSLIVPVFNEESRVMVPFAGVIEYLQKTYPRWELIYVDDGSTDTTFLKLKELQQQYPFLRIIQHSQNQGKGKAVMTGFQHAEGNVLLFSDADFSTPIEESYGFLELIDSGADIVIGSRGLPESNVEIHQAWPRETMGKIFNGIVRMLLPLDFSDTQCGFKMFTGQVVEIILPRMKTRGFAFDVEMLLIAQIHGFKIIERPVTWRNVRDSKVHPIRNSMEMLTTVLKIRYRWAMNAYL